MYKKNLHESSRGDFKTMAIYQTDDYALLQIKRKKSLIDFNTE